MILMIFVVVASLVVVGVLSRVEQVVTGVVSVVRVLFQ